MEMENYSPLPPPLPPPHHHHEEEEKMIRVLYEASHKGCVSTLNSLIQQDPLLLHKINSRTTFIDTPLHISASLGHLELTKALLSHKPNLAMELDSFKSTPLHLASAEGHLHIVKELLAAHVQACSAYDQDGRIPLHLAIIRGRQEVVTELVRAKPDSLKILLKGRTVLHLCVTYNHLEILKALVDSCSEICDELLSLRDWDGNTILHLAVTFKQVETVRYLVSIPKIKEATTLKNKVGFTASDIADGIPKDMNSLEIQIILMSKKDRDIMMAPTSGDEDAAVQANNWMNKCHWRNMPKYVEKWSELSAKWLTDMRGNLGTVSTVISTMTFQALINPPGSFVQQGINIHSSPLACLDVENSFGCPGDSLLVSRGSVDDFRMFIYHNTVAFIASMGVTLLLISGLPLQNRVVMLIFSMAMCVTLTALARAYFSVLYLIIPDQMWNTAGDQILRVVGQIWEALFGVVSAYVLLAFLIWILKHCIRLLKRIARLLSPHTHSSPVSRLP